MKVQKRRSRDLVTAMTVSALVLMGAGCSKTETTELSSQALYAVLEVRPLRGTAPEGSRFGPVRVMVVDPRFDTPAGKQLEAEGFPMDCPAPPRSCESVTREHGRLLLRTPGTHVLDPGALSSWEDGEVRVVRGTQLSFTTLERGPVLTLSGSADAPAEARVKLLHKCEVRVLQVNYSSREGGGIFSSSSKRDPRSWAEVTWPPCFSGPDREVELPFLSPEQLERQEAEEARRKAELAPHLAKVAEGRAKQEAAYARREERRAAIERAANEWAEKHPPESTGWDALSPLERKLNPKAAGLMHAGQLSKLSFDWRCLRYRTRRSKGLFKSGSGHQSCKNSGHVLMVEWRDTGGSMEVTPRATERETGSWSEQRRADTLAELFTRVWVDENGWLRIERPERFDRPLRSWVTEPPEETVIDEVQETLRYLAFDFAPPGDPDREWLLRLESGAVVGELPDKAEEAPGLETAETPAASGPE